MEKRHSFCRLSIFIALAVFAFNLKNAAFAAVPNPPTLTSPSNGSNAGGTVVQFRWTQVADATNYYLQVATDSGFTSVIFGQWIGNYIGIDLSGFPDNGQIYYWRVAGGNAEGSGYFSGAWYFINGPSAVPAVPTLVSPTNGSNKSGTTILFQWSQAARANNYYLQVATDSGFSNIIYGAWVGNYTGVYLSGFSDNGQTYYWRVAAGNSLGSSSYSGAWYFINGPSSVPDVPVQIYPTDGSNMPGNTILFEWNPSARANNYYLQVATDSGFTNIIYGAWVGNYIGVYLSGFPDNGQTYYWHVAAGNSLGSSSYASTWSFINGPSSIPDTPALVFPTNGSNVAGNTILFEWSLTARANNYYLQVATDSGFSNIIYGAWVGNYIGVYLSGFPDDGQTYYWRVAAGNSLGSSYYSGAWYFINGPSSVPDTPVLSSPADGSSMPGTTIEFRWSPAARANNYYLQVATDSSFANIVFGQWIGNYSGVDMSGFANDETQYYWRVAAGNSLGSGPYSDTWSFINGAGGCVPTVNGSGMGLLGSQPHIDTCYDSSNSIYWMLDISRRLNETRHSHYGRMRDDAYILTMNYSTGLMDDPDNIWNAANQASGVDAHVYAGLTYDYLNLSLGLNSFDNAGSSMFSAVEDATEPDGAYWWNGMVGFGIGFSHLPFSGALDAVAHEWGHAVTEKASQRQVVTCQSGYQTTELCYEYESGALNEAFSDWMGTAVEYYYRGYNSNWTMGEDIKTLRDLSNPSAYTSYCSGQNRPQPDHMNGYINCSNDGGGVHLNSGIPNKMFYLLSEGGTHPVSNITVQGIGISSAIWIAYRANMDYWQNKATFKDALDGMVAAAEDIYGLNSNEVNQVKNAWAAVGIGTIPAITASASPSSGGTVSGGGSYPWGASATVTASANSGYQFVNWTENGNEVSRSATYTFTVNGSRTLVANFTVDKPIISISPTSHNFGYYYVGEVSPPRNFIITNTGTQALIIGSIYLIGVDASDFIKENDNCTGQTLDVMTSCTIQARFSPASAGIKNASLSIPSNDPDNGLLDVPLTGTGATPPTFTIAATAGIGGSITPSGSITVTQGGSQTFTIASNIGYYILDVQVDGISQGAITSYTFTNVTADHTISASFVNITYTITATTGAGGNISPSGAVTVFYGSSQTFTITPNTGYHVADVLVDGSSVGAVTTYTFSNVTSNHTIEANFAVNTYALTVSKTGTGAGTITSVPTGINCGSDCTEAYVSGTVVTLTATPATGSIFTGWSGGGCSGTGTCTVTMNSAANVTATFTKIRFEENDTAITYTGSWNTLTCLPCSGGALKYSTQTGARADFSFNGRGIRWIVARANMLGKAKVYLDSVYVGLIDLYNPTPQYQVVLEKTGLSPGNHTIRIEVSGQKNASSTGYAIDIDAFEIVP